MTLRARAATLSAGAVLTWAAAAASAVPIPGAAPAATASEPDSATCGTA